MAHRQELDGRTSAALQSSDLLADACKALVLPLCFISCSLRWSLQATLTNQLHNRCILHSYTFNVTHPSFS